MPALYTFELKRGTPTHPHLHVGPFIDISSCDVVNGGCEFYCNELQTQLKKSKKEKPFECSCPPGMILNDDGLTCNSKGLFYINIYQTNLTPSSPRASFLAKSTILLDMLILV